MIYLKPATIGEEIFNSVTHGVGTIASIIGLVFLEILAFRNGNTLQIVTLNVYGLSLFFLFLFSTLYHSIQAKKAKEVLRLFDHILVYFLIAGTYTPVLALILKVKISLGLGIMGAVWAMALLGILLKIFLINKMSLSKIDLFFYLFLGWSLIFILPIVQKVINTKSLTMLLIGGLFYTTGTIFYKWHGLKFHHAYWHIFVLLGSLTHYFAIINLS